MQIARPIRSARSRRALTAIGETVRDIESAHPLLPLLPMLGRWPENPRFVRPTSRGSDEMVATCQGDVWNTTVAMTLKAMSPPIINAALTRRRPPLRATTKMSAGSRSTRYRVPY